jgi:hypothetical protein
MYVCVSVCVRTVWFDAKMCCVCTTETSLHSRMHVVNANIYIYTYIHIYIQTNAGCAMFINIHTCMNAYLQTGLQSTERRLQGLQLLLCLELPALELQLNVGYRLTKSRRGLHAASRISFERVNVTCIKVCTCAGILFSQIWAEPDRIQVFRCTTVCLHVCRHENRFANSGCLRTCCSLASTAASLSLSALSMSAACLPVCNTFFCA